MPFQGFEGPAGSGKTHRLMEAVEQRLQNHPLLPHQKILSLTFMHGSRRRLDAEFKARPILNGKAVAMTIDSFAVQVWNRWRTLAASLGAQIGDFNQTCDACGNLLEHDAVAKWVARSYPVVMVDEAQELALPRLRMISALSGHSAVFVAADEFQCLDEGVDTAPFMAWFGAGEITQLNQIHRTNQAGLLAAGVRLRGLSSPQEGAGLLIRHEFPNLAPFKIGAAIFNSQGSKAVLYPPAGGQWAQALTQRLAQGLHSPKYNIPPIFLSSEPRVDDEIELSMVALGHLEGSTHTELLARIDLLANSPRWMTNVRASIFGSARRMGKMTWTDNELRDLMGRITSNYRAYSGERLRGVPLMPIHQAKNRQFDHVIIIWPPGVPGTAEFKARLLYNGITRARRSCKVFVRTAGLLVEPPFRFAHAQNMAQG